MSTGWLSYWAKMLTLASVSSSRKEESRGEKTVRVAQDSRSGNRADNEDSAFTKLAPSGSMAIAAVADGMGGHVGGKTASRAALEPLAILFGGENGSDAGEIAPPSSQSALDSWLQELCREANESVLRRLKEKKQEEGGTTLAVTVVTPSKIGVMNVGDTRVYRVDERVDQLSEDHTAVAERKASGASYDELVHSPYRHSLSRCLGESPAPDPHVTVFNREDDLCVLACSDGVYGALTRGEIYQLVGNRDAGLDKIASELTRVAVKKDGSDNATVALVRIS